MTTLSLRNISKKFGDTEVINDFNADIDAGEFLVLLGASGSGKSTLLRIIAGLTEATSGDVVFDNLRVNRQSPRERDIAFVFQSYALYPHLNVKENIGFPLVLDKFKAWHHIPGINMLARRIFAKSRDVVEKVDSVATMLGLDDYAKRKPGGLSGGQRQRVALARALVRDPSMFLLDEPLSNLDAKLRTELRTEIVRLHELTGKTFVYVTHDQVEAMTMATQVAILHNGVVQQHATPQEIFEHPANTYVARFIGSPPMNLMKATVTDGMLRVGKVQFAAPAWLADGKVTFGLRPEHMTISSDGVGPGLPGKVRRIEDLGADTLIGVLPDPDLDLDAWDLNQDELIWVRQDHQTRLMMGDSCLVSLNPDFASYFDKETGHNLAMVKELV
ncbi:ABC-type maltose/maltodextrin transport system, ATPase component [Arthrobacter sp. PAMC 25486]|uniref:ABC transporter ATP-binding protein n=1 Tax=Arthrobacter sp. PAMC 25486 TaxID=1494608 RepID=UPI00053600BF|nr:ABC transporter ATP-binding protein [Arthrobacter sp. PAMC 25486]AIY02967.1 ABC-type maltose/maltodextrin transport system, ATPase component [Arthrobacter sp. PAMC 25486]